MNLGYFLQLATHPHRLMFKGSSFDVRAKSFEFRTIKTCNESEGSGWWQKRNKNNWIHFIIYRREKNLTSTQKCCETLFFCLLFLHSHFMAQILFAFVLLWVETQKLLDEAFEESRINEDRARWERENCWTNCWEWNYSTSANRQKNYNHQTVVLFNFNLQMNEATTNVGEWRFLNSNSNRLRFIALWTLEARNNELFSTFASLTLFRIIPTEISVQLCLFEWNVRQPAEKNTFFIQLNEAEVLDCEWWRRASDPEHHQHRDENVYGVEMNVLALRLVFSVFHSNTDEENEGNKLYLLDFSGEKFSHYLSEKTSKHL